MKIPASQIDSTAKSLPGNFSAALFYGPDQGLVAERAKKLCAQLLPHAEDPFSLVELSGENLKENPAKFFDELSAMGFFGSGRRVIKIRQADGDTTDILKNFLEDETLTANKELAFVVVMGGDLDTKSGLRALFEKSHHAVALPCYQDDERSLRQVISGILQEAGCACDAEALNYLQTVLGGDRMIVRSELAKLVLYVGAGNRVTQEAAEAAVGNVLESSLDDVARAMADGNLSQLFDQIRLAYDYAIAPFALLRAAMNYITKLDEVWSLTEQGISPNDAMEALRPPIFFKAKPAFRLHMTRWKEARVRAAALEILIGAEIASKQTGAPAELLAEHALMQVAKLIEPAKKAA